MFCKQLNEKCQAKQFFIALVLLCCCTCSLAQNTDRAIEVHAASVKTYWNSQFNSMVTDIEDTQANSRSSSPHILDRQALTFHEDKHPTGIVIRRSEALLEHMKSMEGARDFTGLQARLAEVKKRYNNYDKSNRALYTQACQVRRELVMSNPLLDFDEMIFVTKSGSREGVLQCWDYGYGVNNGGGLYKVSGIKSGAPKITNIIEDSVVKKGRMLGKKLTSQGALNIPALSYDGKKIIFSYVEEVGHRRPWPLDTLECYTKERSFHLYSVNADGSDLVQLTDGKRNDYHPCFLPNGRIVFVSDRRNIMDRCQTGKAFMEFSQPCGTMFSMKADGSDMIPISYHETTELQPSVDNNGMLVYTRWDYIDRDFAAGHHFWICYPDGRDPRAPHGNYALPHNTFEDKKYKDGRADRPWAEYGIKAIPGSRRYMVVAGKHHIAGPWGSLFLLNTAVEDDNKMSQVTLFGNYALLDEANNYDGDMDSGLPNSPDYADPWPLSEEFVITVNRNKVLLLDKFGNSELLFTADKNSCGGIDQIRSPIPLKTRKMPPTIAAMTNQGERYGKKDHKRATISIMNVYESDFEWPKDTKIKWIRVLQLFPYPWHSPWQDQPRVGPGSGVSTRAVLGVVPVEKDGSAYFEAPVEKGIYFQALDENGMAVQSMRSMTYVHPGEQMSCIGCHEKKQKASPLRRVPIALKRAPSKLVPNLKDGSCPLTYARLVEPLLEKCNSCHKENNKPAPNIKKYSFYYHGTNWNSGIEPFHGGYRTVAGQFGAIQSGLAEKMLMKHHRDALTMKEINRVTLWADANSNELGAYYDENKQRAGEVVWPLIDMDPLNPAGIDLMEGRPAPPYPDANTPLMKASQARILKVKEAMDNNNKRLQKDLNKFASGWKLSNCDIGKDSGLNIKAAGRKNVFVTQPLSKRIDCVIHRQIDIAKDGKTSLKLEVGNHPKGNWILIVRINKEEVSRDVIGKKEGETNWKTVITDLSKYAGQKVDVELVNRASGRSNIAGYWGKIEIVANNQAVAAAKPRHEDSSIEQRAADSKWINLFNGKNLDGWEGDPEIWSVKGGCINASGPTSYKQYLINRSGIFKNFILEVKFIPVRGNSGVNYRCHDFKENDRPFEVSGYQCDIGPMGALYDIYTTSQSKRYGIIKKGFNELVNDKSWNTFRIVADGKNLYHYINGALCFKFTDNDARGFREKGFIALEFHDKNVKVKFKDIRVKILEGIQG